MPVEKNNIIICSDSNQNIFGRKRIERKSTSTPLSEMSKALIFAILGFHLMVSIFVKYLCTPFIKSDNVSCIRKNEQLENTYNNLRIRSILLVVVTMTI